MPTPLDDLRAALAGRYDVVREIGRGGMATVYLANDEREGGQVALKVLNPDLAGSVGAERFIREIRIASQLVHPGILAVSDWGNEKGILFYVMPYVDGQSLRDRLIRERQLGIHEAVEIALEVAESLAHAHGQGFIHRDIKPENVMLSGGRALVTDFGIARAVDQAGGEKLTDTGLAVGTPSYMSPEQWTGERVDGRADVYALGCMLYEMLVGEAPFGGPTPQVIMARHVMEPVPSLRVARSTIAPALESVLRKSLAKVPADRFQTAAALAEALRSVRYEASTAEMAAVPTPQPSVPPPLPTPTPPAGTPSRARRSLIAAGAAVVLLVAAAGGLMAWRSSENADPDRTRIVVLPFRNIGAEDNAYFAEGITEEITSRLSGVASLGVIAPTSAAQYRARESFEKMGEELDVEYVIDGSVRWSGAARGAKGVLIDVRLVDVRKNTITSLLRRQFDVEQVFEVQASVADSVLQKLDVGVAGQERQRLAAKPTENLDAYDLYLRGNSYYNRSWSRQDVDSAAIMYEAATRADPRYAAAWAQLGKTHTWMHRLGHDATPDRLRRAREAIARAEALAPELPETHIARGLYHYWGEWDYAKAIEELRTARKIQPSNAWVYLQLGNIYRRQGEWADAVEQYTLAGEFDPRFHVIWFNIGHVYKVVRQYDSAEKYFNRTLTLQPQFVDAYLLLGSTYVAKSGDTARARQMFERAAREVPPDRWRQLYGHWVLGASRVYLGTPEERLGLIAVGRYGIDSALYHLARADAFRELGREAEARAAADSAIAVLEPLRRRTPDIAWVSGGLAIAYAMNGRREEAIAASDSAKKLMNDALDGPGWVINDARVRTLLGDTDRAIDALDLAIRMPSSLSTQWLRLDPAWNPLRGNVRFQRLLERPTVAFWQGPDARATGSSRGP